MAAETLKEQLQKQQAQLTNDRSSFEPHWRELSDFINPRGSRFLVTDVNRDDRRNTKIVDPTATLAARTLSSGMMSGITSPARPWFKLSLREHDAAEFGPVKLWLSIAEERLRQAFSYQPRRHHAGHRAGSFARRHVARSTDGCGPQRWPA